MASSLRESTTSTDLPGAALLPVSFTLLNGLDLKARYHSKRCGGDFFDVITTDSRVIFLLTDISGQRSEGCSLAVSVQNTFRKRAQELFELPGANESDAIAELAHDVNRSLIEAAQGVRYAPAFLGCFNLPLGVLTYHNAGRLLAIFCDRDTSRVLDSGGIPLGLFTHITYEPAVLAFEARAKLLLVTKGVTESRRGGTEFGAERVAQVLKSSTDSASELCDAVLQEAYNFGNSPWSRLYDLFHPGGHHSPDDLTAMALVRTPYRG